MKPKQTNLIILIPVFNDWPSMAILIREIDRVSAKLDLHPYLLVMDDGSSSYNPTSWYDAKLTRNIQNITVIHLSTNLGHQKAIALGLAYINNMIRFEKAIIMDCDGEDRPDDIGVLLEESRITPDTIIFAQRTQRTEGCLFRFFYSIYKLCFRILTGVEISFGNFALIPEEILKKIVYLPEIWNHFAAGIVRAKLPRKAIPVARGTRYKGRSKMNFISLIIHGLSAISIFIEVLTVRLMLLSLIVILVDIIGFVVLLGIRYFTLLAIPGWATTVAIGLVIILFQALVFLALLLFLALNNRTTRFFIPVKDYEDYLFSIEHLR
jgi:polyisoprenyl-phosphate glycosyltransferase